MSQRNYPEFSWSLSRHNTLMDCSRKYAYHYYVSHNGWFRNSPDLARTAYRLKKMTNLPIVFGEIVHTIIEKVIKNYEKQKMIPSEETLIQYLRKELNQAFIDSVKKKDEWFERPKHYKMLHEIYYGGDLQDEAIQEIKERISLCITNFLRSKSLLDLTTKNEVEIIQSEEFRTMTLLGVKVFVVIDFLYKDPKEDKWVIVDWKTGKESDEDRHQLAFYALYLNKEYGVPLDQIEVRNEYLLTGESREYTVNHLDIKHLLEKMEMSLLEMGKYVKDEETNEPIDIDFFTKTDHAWKCDRCNYKELCEQKEPSTL